jgi:RNA polymerase-binding transcription factor DksA
MNARRLEHFAGLLRAERARIVEFLNRIRAAAPATAGHSGATEPGDDSGAGVIGTNPDDDAAVVVRETEALREVDEALRLVLESPHDYGICAQCGRPIPEERLEMLPATRTCGRFSAP